MKQKMKMKSFNKANMVSHMISQKFFGSSTDQRRLIIPCNRREEIYCCIVVHDKYLLKFETNKHSNFSRKIKYRVKNVLFIYVKIIINRSILLMIDGNKQTNIQSRQKKIFKLPQINFNIPIMTRLPEGSETTQLPKGLTQLT